MPNDYIEREILFNTLQLAAKASGAMGRHDSAGIYASAASLVAEQPAADVVEVVHSRVINIQQENDIRYNGDGEPYDNYYEMGECENCGCQMFPEWKGCPMCHAIMDGGENHAD